METYGGWGTEAQAFLKHVTKVAVAKGTRCQGGWAGSHISELGRQLIGVAVARGLTEQFQKGYASRCRDEFLRPEGVPLSELLYGPEYLDDPSLGLGAGDPLWTT